MIKFDSSHADTYNNRTKRFGHAGLLTGNTRNIDPRDAGYGFE